MPLHLEGLAVVLHRAEEGSEGRTPCATCPFGTRTESSPGGGGEALARQCGPGRGAAASAHRPLRQSQALGRRRGPAAATAAAGEGLPKEAIAVRMRAVAGYSLRTGFVTSAAAAGALHQMAELHWQCGRCCAALALCSADAPG